jgi:hypothetical protein
MKKQLILFLFLSLFLMSCVHTNRLTDKDYKWMPYKGNEILVFKSNIGDTDTIFLIRKDTLLAYPEAQTLNGIKYEIVSVFCKHSDPNMSNNQHRYLEGYFFQVEKAIDNRSEINILLSARDAKFYRLHAIKIDSLSEENPIKLETAHGQYNDIYIINAEDYLGSFYQRSNFVTKVYWSKSKGLIRYDKKDNIYWELWKQY